MRRSLTVAAVVVSVVLVVQAALLVIGDGATQGTVELAPLRPTGGEIAMSLAGVVLLVLVVAVAHRWLTRRRTR